MESKDWIGMNGWDKQVLEKPLILNAIAGSRAP